jgi:hypothetical protein
MIVRMRPLLIDLLVRHREKLPRLHPNSEQTRTRQLLVEGRQRFVHEKIRYSNRLTRWSLSPGEPAIQLKHAGAPGVSEAAEVSVQDVL